MNRPFLVSATPFAMVLAAVCMLGVHAAAAQVTGGSISGVVTDQQSADGRASTLATRSGLPCDTVH
jgi:hypothetical protein